MLLRTCSAAPPAAAHAPRYPSFLVAGSPPVPMGIANSPSQAIVAASSQQPFLTANAVDAKLLDGALSQASRTRDTCIPPATSNMTACNEAVRASLCQIRALSYTHHQQALQHAALLTPGAHSNLEHTHCAS